MASTNFTYSPTTGNGNTDVNINANEQNIGTTDKVATITFTNGVSSANVTVRQLFKPYLTQGPTSIPATGGTITVYVYSEYDIVFRSVPNWITISSGNTVYSQGERIEANTFGELPASFRLTAAANIGEARTIQNSGMNMVHYIGNTLITAGTQTIEGYQDAAAPEEPMIAVSPDTLALDYTRSNSKTFTISTTGVSQVNISNGNTTDFIVSPLSGANGTVVTATTRAVNSSTNDKTVIIAVSDNAGGATTKNVSAYQKYTPYLTQGPTSIPSTGGSISVYVYSEYDIVFRSVPTWITISSGSTTYTQGQRIYASTFGTLPATFTLTAEPNTGAERTIQYSGMNMTHYLGNTLITVGAQTVVGYQAAYEPVPEPGDWTLNNLSAYHVGGNMTTGDTSGGSGNITINIQASTSESLTHAMPFFIDGIQLQLTPSQINPEGIEVVFTDTRNSIVCSYNTTNGAWIGVGTITVKDNTVITITTRTASQLSSVNEEEITEETTEETE